MLTITYMEAMHLQYIYTALAQQLFNTQFVQHHGYGLSVVGVMKVGNIAQGAGIELTSLAFQASVITITPSRLPDVITLSRSICVCGS